MKVKVIPIVIGVLGTIPKGWVKGLEELEITGQVSIIKIGQNTEKSLGDLRFVVIETPVKNYQQILVRKTLKGVK